MRLHGDCQHRYQLQLNIRDIHAATPAWQICQCSWCCCCSCCSRSMPDSKVSVKGPIALHHGVLERLVGPHLLLTQLQDVAAIRHLRRVGELIRLCEISVLQQWRGHGWKAEKHLDGVQAGWLLDQAKFKPGVPRDSSKSRYFTACSMKKKEEKRPDAQRHAPNTYENFTRLARTFGSVSISLPLSPAWNRLFPCSHQHRKK